MLNDLRQALRNLAKSPWLSLAAVLTLMLGVGATTTAATVVRGVLLAPLAYPEAGQLVRLYQTLDHLRGSSNPRLAAIWNRLPVSYLNAAELRVGNHTLADLGLYLGTTAVLEGEGEPQEVPAARVQAELLRVLGVEPLLGRLFTPDESEQGERLVLLGHGLWQRVFGADRNIVGRALHLDGAVHTVVGVMPPGFDLPERQDKLWTPLTPSEDDRTRRDNYYYAAIGRLTPGTSLMAAKAELERLAAMGRPTDDASASGGGEVDNADTPGLRLVPLRDTVVGDSRRLVHLLAAAAAVVLLIACVNVAHLLLVQGADRRHEFALRVALGASRWRLLRRLGTESLLLALAGGMAGLALASAALRGLATLAADALPRIEEVTIDGDAALIALAASLVAALVAGLLPALKNAGVAPHEAIAEGQYGDRSGTHSGLVVAEVALALMLTACAVLLASSWQRLAAVDPGFEPRGVLVQEIRLPAWRYTDPVRRQEFAERLLLGLEALPTVRAAALTSRLPVAGPVMVGGFRIAGQDAGDEDWTQGRIAAMHFATPDYFRLLGIPLMAGRPFDVERADAEKASTGRREVVVNRTLAARHWPAESALGAELIMGEEEVFQVVGVMDDMQHLGAAEDPGELIVRPWSQQAPAAIAVLIAIATDTPMDQTHAVHAVLRRLDPALPLPPAVSLEQVVAGELAEPRSRMLLVGLLAGMALLLMMVGTYGVMAYNTGRRRREIGIRMALGADAARVRKLVLRRTLRLAMTGIAIGIVGALIAGRLLQGLLYGVEASDPLILAGAALLLTATCWAAGYLPARRASRLEPALTLRRE